MLGADHRRWRRVRLPVLWDGDSEGGSRGSRTKVATGSRLYASRLGWLPGTTGAGVRGAVPSRLLGSLFQLQVSQASLGLRRQGRGLRVFMRQDDREGLREAQHSEDHCQPVDGHSEQGLWAEEKKRDNGGCDLGLLYNHCVQDRGHHLGWSQGSGGGSQGAGEESEGDFIDPDLPRFTDQDAGEKSRGLPDKGDWTPVVQLSAEEKARAAQDERDGLLQQAVRGGPRSARHSGKRGDGRAQSVRAGRERGLRCRGGLGAAGFKNTAPITERGSRVHRGGGVHGQGAVWRGLQTCREGVEARDQARREPPSETRHVKSPETPGTPY